MKKTIGIIAAITIGLAYITDGRIDSNYSISNSYENISLSSEKVTERNLPGPENYTKITSYNYSTNRRVTYTDLKNNSSLDELTIETLGRKDCFNKETHPEILKRAQDKFNEYQLLKRMDEMRDKIYRKEHLTRKAKEITDKL